MNTVCMCTLSECRAGRPYHFKLPHSFYSEIVEFWCCWLLSIFYMDPKLQEGAMEAAT
jgi:hypothetical protein